MDNTPKPQQIQMADVAVMYALNTESGKRVASFSVLVDGGMLHTSCEVEAATPSMLGAMAGCIADHLKSEQRFFPGGDMTEQVTNRAVHVGTIEVDGMPTPHFVQMDVDFIPDVPFED